MDNLSKDYIPSEHGIIAFNMDEEVVNHADTYRMYWELEALVCEPKCNPGVQLMRWKKLGPQLLKHFEVVDKINKGYQKILDKNNKREQENLRKKWRPDEDEMLIELASTGTMSMTDLAQAIGRTPSAISSRLSTLVGIGRVSQEIAGRFTGTMNGQMVSGNISGTLERGKFNR